MAERAVLYVSDVVVMEQESDGQWAVGQKSFLNPLQPIVMKVSEV